MTDRRDVRSFTDNAVNLSDLADNLFGRCSIAMVLHGASRCFTVILRASTKGDSRTLIRGWHSGTDQVKAVNKWLGR